MPSHPRVSSSVADLEQYVILVGGFGRCKYLYERLRVSLASKAEVLQAEGFAP